MQRYHDRVARRYDTSYEDAFWQWHDTLTWEYLKPHLPRDQSAPMLDLGCGTGKWAMRLLAAGYPVTCVDIAGKMIDQTRRKVETAGLTARALFLQADISDLSDLSDQSYALAVAFGEPICCAESPARALKQIRRKLRPNGRLVATLDNRLSAVDFYLERGDLDGLTTFLKTGVTHWLTQDADERFALTTYTPALATKLFEKSGYEVVEMLGKTVLPMRHYRSLLADPENRRRLTAIERKLARELGAVGRAPHLQITARRHDD